MTYSAVNTYQEVEVQSMTPAGRVVFMYEHLLGKLELASYSEDPERYQNALLAAQDTVAELMGSLKLDVGGEIATNLNSLYSFFLRELLSLSDDRNDPRLVKLSEMILDLKGAWATAATQVSGTEPAR